MRRLSLLLACSAFVASVARAQDRFEIQVYDSDINPPLKASLELHANYTVVGYGTPAYDGETPTDRAARFTFEPAFGVTEYLEVGGYLQTVAAPGYGFKYAGVKLRAMGVVPRRLSGAFDLGLNLEISCVPRAAEKDTWGTELRPVLGWRSKWIGIWLNPIVDWSLSGAAKWRPEFMPSARVSVNTQQGFAVGLEYYTGLGAFADGMLPAREQTHLLVAAFDLAPPEGAEPSPWSVNLGLGKGLTDGTPQQWIMKAIIGRSF